MRSIQIRTNDEVLKRALEGWWAEFEPCAPADLCLTLTDLESFPKAGGEEITLSRTPPCHLLRPFSFEQLEELITGRPSGSGKRLILQENKALLDGRELDLTPLEHRMLVLLAEHSKENPISAAELSLALWGEERASNQINVYISYLRQKTDLPHKERLIHTLRGRGFYLKNER